MKRTFFISLILIICVLPLSAQYPPKTFFDKFMKQIPDSVRKYQNDTSFKGTLQFIKMNLNDSLREELGKSLNQYFMENTDAFRRNKLTPEQLLSLIRISDFKISPDGKWIAYVKCTPDLKENKTKKDIFVVSLDGNKTIQITNDAFANYNPIWSPDGRKLAYISTLSGKPQAYLIDFPETNANLAAPAKDSVIKYPENIKAVSTFIVENGISNLSCAPDGKHFAFTTDVVSDSTVLDKYPQYPKAKVRIYDYLPVRHWDEWQTEKYSHLFIVGYDNGKFSAPEDIMPREKYDVPVKPFGGAEEIAWSPDGLEIAYTSKKVNNYAFTTNTDIFVYNLINRTTKNITEDLKGCDKDPLYSPDGRWLAFHSQEREGFESDRVRLMLYNRENHKIKELSKTLDQWVGECVWAADSKSLYFSAEDKAVVPLYKMDVEDGKWSVITKGWFNYDAGLEISKDGSTIVCGRRTMLRPTEIFTMNTYEGDPSIKQITHANDNWYRITKLPKITERWIESVDGKKVHCWVIFPPDFDSTKKYPMITYCQGGPQSTISQYFSYRWNFHLMASEGYIVLAPNRRGMPGFGQEWNDAISGDWGGKPMQDILAATDALKKEPYVDREGLCAVGASAGGYATYWLEGNHDGRFKAFVAHAGVFNMESMYGSTEELWFPNWENGGPYWEKKNKKFYEENSPHKFANNWDTPILISAGENDFRVPYTQALEAYTVAQSKGIPSKLILFPEENHWISSLQNSVLWHTEFFKFLNTYCKKQK